MTLSPWLIYAWGIADNLRGASMGICVLTGMLLLIGAIFVTVEWDEIDEEIKQKLKHGFRVALVSFWVALTGALFIPSSKTIAVMVIAPALVNSKPVQQDLPELYSIAVQAIKDSFAKEASK